MRVLCALTLCLLAPIASAAGPVGYYRQPALHGDTLVFVSEGDLWRVPAGGGVAARLTSHASAEGFPALSPDGKWLAFTAHYEGPTELYVMPAAGGRPRRLTHGAGKVIFVGWGPRGKLLYSTDRYATLPASQLVALDLGPDGAAKGHALLPLAQASEGCYDDEGKTLFFTRLPFQGSHTRRYRGGTAQNLWRFTEGEAEARPLTASWAGTSKCPLFWQGRVYFASDRDGTMNLWSMQPDGTDLRQHTRHSGWDVASPSLSRGRIAYQLGADLRLYDIAADRDQPIPITLESDLDQTREHWIKRPLDYLSAVHLAPDGSRVALTARGQVFVAPHRRGRFVEAARRAGVRYRDARFLPAGKGGETPPLLALSDESGEVELWKLPANGVGKGEQLTRTGSVLRWQAIPSPDGKLIAHTDKNQRLFLYDVEKKQDRTIDESPRDGFTDLAWAPDGRWLAYVAVADNLFHQIKLYGVTDGKITPLTTDRYDSYSPAWSSDGRWLYFLSDRHLHSLVESPWGSYQPEPFLDRKTKVYHLPVTPGLRSPFDPPNELTAVKEPAAKPTPEKPTPAQVKIDLAGIQGRLLEVPVPAGNYSSLAVNDKGLFWLSAPTGSRRKALMGLPFTRQDAEVKTVAANVRHFELSGDGKKLLLRRADDLFIVDAAPAAANLDKKEVDLSGWTLAVEPREEWRQMFAEAWRLERDYFYDRGMHGVDWKAVRAKYRPLVERVHDRAELSDLLAQMVSELSALHIFVRGGDARRGSDNVQPASLGAVLERDEAAGGYRVRHVYRHDPDEPEKAGPLDRPGVRVRTGDLIESINGTPLLSVADPGRLLRGKAGQQVLLHVRPGGQGKGRDVIARPISQADAADLRYHEWEYTRRQKVEEMGQGDMGYVHLRAMGSGNFGEWARAFYPVFNRKGLIIDVRNNRGGNIDSWILGRLLRRSWFFWSQRVGQAPSWNMQYAFRGHVVVLCNEHTASDGEAFAEGVRRLGIGKVIGTRTWGGEIWLTGSNFLVDRGIATAAEFGVYGPQGDWLIEGHGVEPDVVVDNLPHATFQGRDAQLEAAVAYLRKRIKEKPVEVPAVPKFPDKAFRPRPATK